MKNMLSAVKAIGEHVYRTTDNKENRFVESSKLKDIKNVWCINFNYTNGKATYMGVFSEAFDPDQSTKYLYRVFNHRRFEATPTSKLSEIEKLKKRFELWFKLCCSKYIGFEGSDTTFLQALNDEFLEKSSSIFSEISERIKALNKNEIRNTIVTITINSEKHLADFEIFNTILKKEACDGFYVKHNVESKGMGKCYLCNVEKEVLGFASPFPVYTLEKKGFAPNFLQEDSWKRLPICIDCAISSIMGREFVEKYLFKSFYGINFYVIPSFALNFDENVFSSIISPKKKLFCNSW